MGKKIDALLGRRTFKTSKFKPAISLAISRLSVLKNQRRARLSVARSDVVELLNLGHQDRALIRVEQVIKEQNMLDVFVMVEGYCHLLVERLNLVEKEKECPEELEEVVSSLIYVSTRCGEFPELQEMRAMFTSRFGKDFVARAAELRNNCRVNTKVVIKLSTRQPNREIRVKVLKDIASESGISLQYEEAEEESSITGKDDSRIMVEDKEKAEGFSESMKVRKKYKDVADAAQAAFESAAYAAEAARAAVELSRSESHDSDDPYTPTSSSKKIFNSPRVPNGQGLLDAEEYESLKTQRSVYEDGEMKMTNNDREYKQKKNARENSHSLSGSSLHNSDSILQGTAFSTNTAVQRTAIHGVTFDDSDDENGTGQNTISSTGIHDIKYDTDHGLLAKKDPIDNSSIINDEDTSEWKSRPATSKSNYTKSSEAERSLQLNLEKRPLSVRTR